ncbi:MAG TPA: hypothetical protein VND67_11605 [Acidimicrobiales bacterium]|nr:hypothetical protein [Acidimicrobiales bacterium]
MVDDPDFRTDKSESIEGRGLAAGKWGGYHYSLPEEVVAEAFSTSNQAAENLTPELRDGIAEDALERSELVGFWVAWHLAGGFANLERGGWHRATIFRKARRFRAAYGAHPDEYVFPWLELDLSTAWSEQLSRRLELARTSQLAD